MQGSNVRNDRRSRRRDSAQLGVKRKLQPQLPHPLEEQPPAVIVPVSTKLQKEVFCDFGAVIDAESFKKQLSKLLEKAVTNPV